MNGRDIEDDGFYTAHPEMAPCPAPPEPGCLAAPGDGGDGDLPCPKCLDTGYRRDWRGMKVQCDDCWNDNGPES